MCRIMDELRKQAEMNAKMEMAKGLYEQSVDIEVIAKSAGVSVDTVRGWLGISSKS